MVIQIPFRISLQCKNFITIFGSKIANTLTNEKNLPTIDVVLGITVRYCPKYLFSQKQLC